MKFEFIFSDSTDVVYNLLTKVQCDFQIGTMRISSCVRYICVSDTITAVHIRAYSQRVEILKYYCYCSGSEDDESRLRCR